MSGRTSCAASAASLGIEGLEDPMNRDQRFDRVYLRHEVWPLIEGRWPAAATALARAAQHLGCGTGLARRSDIPGGRAAERRRCALGARLAGAAAARAGACGAPLAGRGGGEPPSTARLGEALRQMLTAHADHGPEVKWGEHMLRADTGTGFS